MSKVALTCEEKDFESSMELDPFSLFINAIRAEQTRTKYQARLNTFFDYISLPDTNLEERCKKFIHNCHGNSKHSMSGVFIFIIYPKRENEKKGICLIYHLQLS